MPCPLLDLTILVRLRIPVLKLEKYASISSGDLQRLGWGLEGRWHFFGKRRQSRESVVTSVPRLGALAF